MLLKLPKSSEKLGHIEPFFSLMQRNFSRHPLVLDSRPPQREAWHESVMVREVLELFSPRSGGRFIDATLGDGGHAEAILARTGPRGMLLGIERDPKMAGRANRRLQNFGNRVVIVQASYEQLLVLAGAHGFMHSDGVLFDLGVAAWHFVSARRGFSFREDEPLDMRFDPSEIEEDAAHIVNGGSYEELVYILHAFGEEREASRIAKAIIRNRPIVTTRALADLIVRTKHIASRRIHPATKSFQAFRIAVNRELEIFASALPRAVSALRVGGILLVIAYHSLEDRTAKRFLQNQVKGGSLALLTKRPLRSSREEMRLNPRARSAKLRAAVRTK